MKSTMGVPASNRRHQGGAQSMRPRLRARPLSIEPLEDRRLLAITVDSLSDELDGSLVDGDISLRDAVASAAPAETILFDSALAGSTLSLTLGQLVLARPVIIDASSLEGGLTIDASGSDPTPQTAIGDGSRVVLIDDGDGGTQLDVVLRGLALVGGDVAGSGGAILNREQLTVINTAVSGNRAERGGGIHNEGGTARLLDTSVFANTATAGGGIANDGMLRVSNSTISGNDGGGIVNGPSAELEMFGTTITDNVADGASGLKNDGIVVIGNTIVAGNRGTGDAADVEGDFDSQGHNLIGNVGSAASGFVASDIVGTSDNPLDPRLAPLANNGGFTPTHALLPGSLAIDAGETGDLGRMVVTDVSGNNSNAAIIGAINPAGGIFGQAAEFPAGGEGLPENYLSVDVASMTPSQFPTAAITVAAWVRLTQTELRHPIFQSRNADGQLIVNAFVNDDGKTVFTVQDDSGDTLVRFVGGDLRFGPWFHYAITYDLANNRLAFYVNGNLSTSFAGPPISDRSIGADWGSGARIGSSSFDPGSRFSGQFTGRMDEFYLFARALTDSEVATLARATGGPVGTPLVTGNLSLYYPFEVVEAATDQRGELRVVDGDGIHGAAIDIGAFERVNDFNAEDPIPAAIESGSITVRVESVAEGLISPSLVVSAGDSSDRIFVSDQIGLVHLIKGGALQPTPFLDITEHVRNSLSGNDERGLSGFTFHPDFANDGAPGHGVFYTWTDELVDDLATVDFTHFPLAPGVQRAAQTVLREWSMDDIADDVFAGSSREMIRIDQPHQAHSAGGAQFGPDGYLYLSLGDGGTHDDQGPGHNPDIGNARDRSNVYGSMLRIDPFGTNSANGKYGIPADNPFVDEPGALDEIFFYGLRNPFRFSFERDADRAKTTKIVIGDTGQDDIEEVDRADIVVDAGGNFGWNIKEGTFLFDAGPPPGPDGELRIGVTADSPGSPLGLIDPIVQYDHGPNGEGSAVIGGYTYQGDAIPELRGQYVFADFNDFSGAVPNGRIFYADLSDADPEIFELNLEGEQLSGSGGVSMFVKGIGIDDAGELYVAGSTTLQSGDRSGRILKLSPVLPADFDGNRVVDGDDLLLWQAGFGIASGASKADGDANGDGAVDGDDFLIWQSGFAAAAPADGEALGTVPRSPPARDRALIDLASPERTRRARPYLRPGLVSEFDMDRLAADRYPQ